MTATKLHTQDAAVSYQEKKQKKTEPIHSTGSHTYKQVK